MEQTHLLESSKHYGGRDHMPCIFALHKYFYYTKYQCLYSFTQLSSLLCSHPYTKVMWPMTVLLCTMKYMCTNMFYV